MAVDVRPRLEDLALSLQCLIRLQDGPIEQLQHGHILSESLVADLHSDSQHRELVTDVQRQLLHFFAINLPYLRLACLFQLLNKLDLLLEVGELRLDLPFECVQAHQSDMRHRTVPDAVERLHLKHKEVQEQLHVVLALDDEVDVSVTE